MDRTIPLLAGLAVAAAGLWYADAFFPGLYLSRIALSLIAVAAACLVVRFVLGRFLIRYLASEKTRYTANRFGTVIILILVVVLLARIWIPDLSSIVLSVGVIGAGVAIALQDVFRNFAGGIIIVGTRMYEVGDRVEIDGDRGDVIDIGMMNTTLLEVGGWVSGDQPTGRVTSIPNGKVITMPLNNYTRDHSFIWEELTIPITYGSDWKRAKEIILGIVRQETLAATGQAEKEIARLGEKYFFPPKVVEPSVYLTPTDNWITFHIRYVTDTRQRRLVATALYEAIIARLQEIPDITIASGTLTVTLAGTDGGKPGPGGTAPDRPA